VISVIFSKQADADLEEIGDFIALGSPLRAASFVQELKSKCLKLGNTASIGAPRPELGEGIRMLPHDRYLIFYREAENTLRIVRILHSARDRDNLAL
jgi:toxin ParE1/3/4